MKSYSIGEARARLPSLIDEVESGKEVELTRRGRPIAIVVSRQEYARLRSGPRRFGDLYREFLERYSLREIGVSGEVFEDSRDRDEARKVDL
jgi:prevent-host-death family protein